MLILSSVPSTTSHSTYDILADKNHLIVISECEPGADGDQTSPPVCHIYSFAKATWWVGQLPKSELETACVHEDGSMLILCRDYSLHKCKVDSTNEELTEQWKCTDLDGSLSICSASGVTYVGADCCIYVISKLGELQI